MRKSQILSIIIPVYNELKTIDLILSKVKKADILGLKKEIVIVDDGSTDGTIDYLRHLKDKEFRIFFHRSNQGKGAALRTGFLKAKGDIILIQDADLEYSPDEYPVLLKPILDSGADVVFSSRFITGQPHRVLYYWHSVGNKFITWLTNMAANLNLSDIESGYKVFTRDVLIKILPKLSSKRFNFEPEFALLVAKVRPLLKIYEVGISYSGRTYQEGKKIRWYDAIEAIVTIVKTIIH